MIHQGLLPHKPTDGLDGAQPRPQAGPAIQRLKTRAQFLAAAKGAHPSAGAPWWCRGSTVADGNAPHRRGLHRHQEDRQRRGPQPSQAPPEGGVARPAAAAWAGPEATMSSSRARVAGERPWLRLLDDVGTALIGLAEGKRRAASASAAEGLAALPLASKQQGFQPLPHLRATLLRWIIKDFAQHDDLHGRHVRRPDRLRGAGSSVPREKAREAQQRAAVAAAQHQAAQVAPGAAQLRQPRAGGGRFAAGGDRHARPAGLGGAEGRPDRRPVPEGLQNHRRQVLAAGGAVSPRRRQAGLFRRLRLERAGRHPRAADRLDPAGDRRPVARPSGRS